MKLEITRDELISIIGKLLNADGTEEELDEALFNLIEMTGMHQISDMIYYPEQAEVTAEEIADAVLSYEPARIGGPS